MNVRGGVMDDVQLLCFASTVPAFGCLCIYFRASNFDGRQRAAGEDLNGAYIFHPGPEGQCWAQCLCHAAYNFMGLNGNVI